MLHDKVEPALKTTTTTNDNSPSSASVVDDVEAVSQSAPSTSTAQQQQPAATEDQQHVHPQKSYYIDAERPSLSSDGSSVSDYVVPGKAKFLAFSKFLSRSGWLVACAKRCRV